MRGDQLARKWRTIRAIEASPNGLTVTKIAQREETEIRTINRDLDALQANGFPLYTESPERCTRRASIPTFKFEIPPSFNVKTLIEEAMRMAIIDNPFSTPTSSNILISPKMAFSTSVMLQ